MPSGVTEEVKKVIHSHGHVSIASLAILISSMCSPLVAVTSEQKLPWSLLEATMPSTGEQFTLYYVQKGYHDLGTSDHGGCICSLPRTSFEFITQQIFALCGDPPSTLTTTMSGRSSETAFTVVNLTRAPDSTWKRGEHLQQAVESQRPTILVDGPSSQMADTMCPTAIRRQDLPVVVCRPRPTAGQHPASEPLLLAHWPTPAAQQHRVCRDKRQDVSQDAGQHAVGKGSPPGRRRKHGYGDLILGGAPSSSFPGATIDYSILGTRGATTSSWMAQLG